MRSLFYLLIILFLVSSCRRTTSACQDTSTGLVPLYDLADSSFEGFAGGLYPGGNDIPDFWLKQGKQAVMDLHPVDLNGEPDSSGTVGFLTLGYSTAAMTAKVFYQIGTDSALLSHTSYVSGAQAGLDLLAMLDRHGAYWDTAKARVISADMDPQQIQLVWLSTASLDLFDKPFPEQATNQIPRYRQVLSNIKYHFPRIVVVFLSDRAFGGYIAEKGAENLREPSAYYTSWAVKWTIEDLMKFPSDSIPFTDWGPVLWTDGVRGNRAGRTWTCEEAGKGGIHPSAEGRMEEAQLLYDFFSSTPYLEDLR